MKVLIRQENPGDYVEVERLVKMAFTNAEQSDEDEHNLVARLRKEPDFIPELSLIAVLEGEIIGHVLFSRVTIGDTNTKALALAPLSVHPMHQGNRVGTMLVRKGHEKARELGFSYSIVLGHPDYYPRFGYRPAILSHISAPFPVPEDSFFALKLIDSAPDTPGGKISYQQSFFQ